MFANVGGNQNRKVIRWTTESDIFLMLKIFVMIPISILAQEKLPTGLPPAQAYSAH